MVNGWFYIEVGRFYFNYLDASSVGMSLYS